MRKKIVAMLLGLAALVLVAGCADEVNTNTGGGTGTTTNPMGTLQGFVRDHTTNAPLANVTVRLYATGERVTTTNANGYWYFADVQAQNDWNNYEIYYSLTATGYLDMMGQASLDEQVGYPENISWAAKRQAATGQTNSLRTVNDYMVKPATLSGFVTDVATGKGINNATVIMNLATSAQMRPSNGNAYIMVAPQYTATTAANATSGAAGYYTLSVPALYIYSGYIGAFASGYEYNTIYDVSDVNLQYASSALADFRLTPVDNNLGLVVAQVSVSTTNSKDLLILRDASGQTPGGSTPNIDLNGATQMMFSLVFDQAVNSTQFFRDTIILRASTPATVFPAMTPVWANDYSVTLTGDFDLKKFAYGTTYQLRTNAGRTIYAKTDNTTIAENTNLAAFRAINSALTSSNPTPALYVTPFTYDTALVGHDGVKLYLSTSQNAPATVAQNYTGISEEVVKNKYTLATNALNNGIDLSWPDSQAVVDLNAYKVYARIVNPASGEVLRNWTNIAITPTLNDDTVVVSNLAVNALQKDAAGSTENNLRFGNQLDFAVTVTDTLGVETPFDETKILPLLDAQAPEVTNTSLASRAYNAAEIDFSEQMNTTAGVSVTLPNSSIMSLSPVWDVAGTTLYIKASGNATASVYDTGAAAGLDVLDPATGTITFNSAGEADRFFVGQVLRLTYPAPNAGTVLCTVGDIDTSLASPTINIGAACADTNRFSATEPITIAVDPTTTLRNGNIYNGIGPIGNGATTFTIAINQPVTVGDKIILRDNQADPHADITVTVADYDSSAGTVTIPALVAPATSSFTTAIFEGDVLSVAASDEKGNAMNGDANEVVWDGNNVFPPAGASASIR